MILTDRFPPVAKIKIPKIRPAYPFGILKGLDAWADQHNILLIGTNQDANDLYYDGFDETLTVNPTTVSGYNLAMDWLKLLPDSVLRAMEPQYNYYSQRIENKAVYFSTAPNRGYAMIMPHNYGAPILECVYPAPILEQGISVWSNLALHEVGHIVDLCGTDRQGYYWQPIWNLADKITLIFDAQGDLITDYAKTNTSEDFAVHFAYYVWRGTYFRDRALTNIDLQQRYNFLRDQIFLGAEYQEEPTGILIIRTNPVAGTIYVNQQYVGLGGVMLELPAGIVRVSFGDVEGYYTPISTMVQITEGETRTLSVYYAKTPPLPPAPPTPLLPALGLTVATIAVLAYFMVKSPL